MPPAGVTSRILAAPREASESRGQPRGEELREPRLGRVQRVVWSVGVHLGLVQDHRQPASGDAGAGPAHVEVDAPRTREQLAAVAVGAQAVRLVEVDDGRLEAGPPAEADAGQGELPLLRLQVLDERAACSGDLYLGRATEHLPHAAHPRAHCGDDHVASDRPVAGLDGLDLPPVALVVELAREAEPRDLHPLLDPAPAAPARSASWRIVCIASAQPPRGSCKTASTGAFQSGHVQVR